MALKKLKIKINGMPLPDSEIDDVVEFSVDTDLFLPAMCSITLQDKLPDFTYINDATRFKPGATLELTIVAQQHNDPKETENVLFKGEITSIEPVFTGVGKAQLCIRGYDRSHRLMRVKHLRAFENVKPSDIVKKIVGEGGLSCKVDSSDTWLFESYLQCNQTDWECIWSLARLIGYQVYVNDNTLYFEKMSQERTVRGGLTLKWGEDLTSFEPRASVMGLLTQSSAIGWDPVTKKTISAVVASTSNSTAPSLSGMGSDSQGSAALKKAFGENADYLSTQPVMNTGQAKDIAAAILAASESDYVRASGYCAEGHPYILAGTKVKLENLGTRFSGTYHITKAVHQWRMGRYTVNFSVSGSGPNTLLHLLDPEGMPDSSRIYGVVTALVTDIRDPKKQGRVKVKYPWLSAKGSAELQSGWARIASIDGGPSRGFFFVPEVNDEVLVAFDHGDPNFPYIVGALWNDKDKPPEGTAPIVNSSGKVAQRVIRTQSGHTVLFVDEAGKEQIIIQDSKGKNSITFDTVKKSITIKAEQDLTLQAGGNVTIDAGGDFTVKSKKKATLEAVDAITLESKKEIANKVPMSTFGLKASGAELSAMKIDVKANAALSLNGGAMAELKGGLVKIN